MLCQTCSVVGICIIANAISPFVHIIDLKDCKHYNGKQEAKRIQRDLTKNFNLSIEDNHKKTKEKIICCSCNKDANDWETCSSCGSLVCAACLIEDLATKKSYCPECYDSIPGTPLLSLNTI